jgi:photosystem II stability/assembly factor-like uncharacterized protein
MPCRWNPIRLTHAAAASFILNRQAARRRPCVLHQLIALGLVVTVALVAPVASPAGADPGRPAPNGPTTATDRLAAWELHQQMGRTSIFRGVPWRCVGPVVQGGRVVDVEPVPNSPYSFYVAYASGGLWRTDNNGVTFTPVFDAQPTLIMGDVAVDPSDSKVVWVGTGENNSSRSSYGGLGVFRSSDGGATWQRMGLEESDRIGRILVDPRDGRHLLAACLGKLYTAGGQRGVYRTRDGGRTWQQTLTPEAAGSSDSTRAFTGAIDLVMDPANPEVIYASTWERSRRPWELVEGGAGSGLWKSTDGGETWTRLAGGFPQGRNVGRIGIDIARSRPATLYAYMDDQHLLPDDQWDLGDGAVTPKRLRRMSKAEFLKQDPEEIEDFIRENDLEPALDAAKLAEMVRKGEVTLEQIVKAIEDANANLFLTDIHGPEVWRSDDGGASWRRTHDQPLREVAYTYGYYFGQIRVAPDDPERVYIMGVPMVMSKDGGKTWTGIDGRDVHGDHHEIWFDPQNPKRLISGNDGGISMSYDGGQTWLVVNPTPVGQFYAVTVDLEKPYNIYGGLQDNGVYKGSSASRPGISDDWHVIGGGDGMYVQVDPRDNATVYMGSQFGYYARVDASGKRQSVRPRNKLTEEPLRYNWETPIQLSAHNPDILYFGANKLFRSMDKGESWTAISPDLTTSKNRGDVPYATITTLHESPRKFGLIWLGTDDGHVHVTTDGGVTWREVSGNPVVAGPSGGGAGPSGGTAGASSEAAGPPGGAIGLPADRWVSRVEASRHNDQVAHLALNGYRDDDMTAYVYRTEDLGATWRDISAGLPDEPVNVIREDPVNPDVLYVGTDRGVYVSLDKGAGWQALPGGPALGQAAQAAVGQAGHLVGALPSVPVHDLVVHPRDRELVAGTHGRSVWIADVLPMQDLTVEVRAKSVHVFALEEVQFERGWRSRRSPWFYRPVEDPFVRVPFWVKAGTAGGTAVSGTGVGAAEVGGAGAGAEESGAAESKAILTIRDGDGRVLRREDVGVAPGVNTWTWDLLVDPKLAVDAEKERVKKQDADKRAEEQRKKKAAKSEKGAGSQQDETSAAGKGEQAKYPWAEAARLGRPLYATAGTYTVRVELGKDSAETKLEVKAAEPRKPRVKPEMEIRGRKKKK